jgi:copper homeostasis protein
LDLPASELPAIDRNALRSSVRLEICVDRLDSAVSARDGGADRIEVCGALACGGVTPGAGLIAACLELNPLEVMVMIRPHAGSFVYSSRDLSVMEREIVAAKQAGAHGVVFGVLTSEREVDREACRRLMAAAWPMATTFHRAFDLVRDPRKALGELIDLGVGRVLSSGQAGTAMAGATLLRSLVEQAAGRIVVMPGAGVNAANAAAVLAATGASDLHASASEPLEPIELSAPNTANSEPKVDRWDFIVRDRWTTLSGVRALRAAITARL